VKLTGKTDGYFSNQAIKILMPDKLRTVEKGLRAAGYGPDVDKLVLSMNRAAEKAAPEAKKIFWDAIGKMSIDDAQRILNGTPTAATDYFKGKTQPADPGVPACHRAMDEVGRRVQRAAGPAKHPVLKTENTTSIAAVVGAALDAFHVAGTRSARFARPGGAVTS
jgi:hypothetical protein